MGLLNVGTRSLQANQVALQTTGHNISNVNTVGYSRQNAVFNQVEGQFTGNGYIGKGAEIRTIQRNYSQFLTRQSSLASSIESQDVMRADKLRQLEELFPGGNSGLGASVNDMLNAFSDVANAPTDLTARTVALTRVDETAARFRAASQSLDDLQRGVRQELGQKVDAINTLAKDIAQVNEEIARTTGSGQPPNDLLDRRDQLIKELNQYVQTTSISADDGTISLFVAHSQPLILGTHVTPMTLVPDEYNDPLKNKVAMQIDGATIMLDDNALGGGEVAGLLRFQNRDMTEARNLLGRLTLAVTTAMNDQHKLGLDMDGNAGKELFSPITFNGENIRSPQAPAKLNRGTGELKMQVTDVTKFAASDYEIRFTGPLTGTVTRLSDNKVVAFPQSPAPASGALVNVDGLDIQLTGLPADGDRFLLKPFSSSASTIQAQFSTPRGLAVASPIAGAMGTNNQGNLKVVNVRANSPTATANLPVTFTFTGTNTYTRSDDPTGKEYTYTPGQAIGSLGSITIPAPSSPPPGVPALPENLPEPPPGAPALSDLAPPPPPDLTIPTGQPDNQWSFVLQGAPKAGDTFTVIDIKDPKYGADYQLNAGNAQAMMDLRDVKMFDNGVMSDGYASMISQIGIRSQSAKNAADVSATVAANVERDRTRVSGVNLDEEAAKMLQYQQAYQASAKMIQIAQNIFDTLMQNMNR
ncbi:flagellar hook-associated protein FlgK [Curvibacter sp. CHRR-16]|uniref:flagellar hook-associated protein FlgK n=1 Tax=Curvibacter sp. CHRR-16 TaxID=2835872 RepID=UPI001BD930F5|nr:flagellar hook-associated protein FlgK [Curvibacter sp. CHRR-16]MBT0569554.1 flagellar hook-associated protein FlgK [Curvibacter sp. CHRR-16]